jgi:hypothetical protein
VQRGALRGKARARPQPVANTKMEKIEMMQDQAHTAELRALELSYTERVNMAVAEDRYDLVDEFAAQYDAELEQLKSVA